MSAARPYRTVNQVDWFGRLWTSAMFVYETELPAYPGKWFGPFARCEQWDSRDWYEFTC